MITLNIIFFAIIILCNIAILIFLLLVLVTGLNNKLVRNKETTILDDVGETWKILVGKNE